MADIFGFGAAVSRKYPHEWEKIKDRWIDIYPDLDVELEVKTKLREHGMISSW
ncbi:MAG: Ger(x)C family spore germination C-terminal domain-containing protein [Eubacteriales bacterium]